MAVVVRIDRDQWSGEGDFTEQLLSWLTEQPGIVSMRVEDASATRADVEYNFISNEIYIEFGVRDVLSEAPNIGGNPTEVEEFRENHDA